MECGSKFPHASKADAERANRRGGLHAYRCTFCRKWHVGSSIIPKRLRFGTNWPASLYAMISLVGSIFSNGRMIRPAGAVSNANSGPRKTMRPDRWPGLCGLSRLRNDAVEPLLSDRLINSAGGMT